MSAATESNGTVVTGDRVFVPPGEERAPLHRRGVAGVVVGTAGVRARVRFGDDEAEWIELAILRVDRRRQRRPAFWGAAEPADGATA